MTQVNDGAASEEPLEAELVGPTAYDQLDAEEGVDEVLNRE
eukprot:CAMPEP_0115763800 /NCGR_PEP_ID=MMETSP0272-20121206/101734_1 /TAXON_ID=71861 /ORGANISM="Scrippsiella trochoidea, Strain CCMP3099" /LENGTH=40 /DNA_ID= /DNA_START= /DNA_END= /DNA_ORIENTATION=